MPDTKYRYFFLSGGLSLEVCAVPKKTVLPADNEYATELDHFASLRPHPQNSPTHTPENHKVIQQSLLTHGYYKNIVIAEDGTLLAGHGVIEAAAALGSDPGSRCAACRIRHAILSH